jgi:hypothetical protein
MAIVQVSRITNRKGLYENLPQLAGAEFGWCVDQRRLFIGNGTLQEGAPVIGNTEILTEFSDLLALSPYTYKDLAVGYAAQTGPDASDPVIRTVQEKLDDFADVRDFGAVGDGVADDTSAVQRALTQLYCRDTNTQVRRTLYFPAGTYRVTQSIVIPTYAKLVGEGADCSIIYLDEAVDISTLTEYVARFGDNVIGPDGLPQTGPNIGNNGGTPPRNIEISSMTFQTGPVTDVFLIEDATQCYFDSVNFLGPLTTAVITANGATDNIAGVRFNSTTTEICNQITFDKCRFAGLTYGLNTDEQIQSVTISNGKFATLYQGVVMGDGAVVNGGPTGVRVVQNMFDTVYGEGIIFDDVSLCASAYNAFYNVGNEFQGAGNPATPVILFGNDDNVSISDLFERDDTDTNSFPRVEIIGGEVTTGTQLQVGRYARNNGRTFIMDDNQSSPATVFTWNLTQSKSFSMNYSIERGSLLRHGVFTVVAYSFDDSVGTLSYSDDYNENIDTGVTLYAEQSGANILIKYTTTNTGDSTGGTLTYSISHLA